MMKSPILTIEILVQADLVKIPDVTTGEFDLGEELIDMGFAVAVEKEVIRTEPCEEPGSDFIGGGREWWESCEEVIVRSWLLSGLRRRRRVIHRRPNGMGERVVDRNRTK